MGASGLILRKCMYLFLLLIAVLVPQVVTSRYILQILIICYIFAVATSSLNLLLGYTGQVSLAHAGFFAIGAYGVAIMTTRSGLNFWWALLLAAAVSALVGLLVGIPMLRTRGSYFAIASLCFGVIVGIVAGSWSSFTGGYLGILGVPLPPPLNLPGIGTLGFQSKAAQYYLALALLLLTLFVMHRLVNSPLGLSFMAVRNNELLAGAVGINTFAVKLLSFTVASFFAGLAGGLYASFMRTVSPEVASIHLMFNWVVYLLLGGAGTLSGPVVGTLAITALTELTQSFKDYSLLVFGALLVVAMIYCPRGLVGAWEAMQKKLGTPLKRFRQVGVRDAQG